MYIDCQRQLWPEWAKTCTFENTSEHASKLADGFKSAFLDPDWAAPADVPTPKFAIVVGSAYLRYSCDHSNPRSLPQQLRNCLEKAATERVFIPWSLIFADAAVTGTTAARRGYQMAKEVIKSTSGAGVLVIDELGRAARDAIESLKLGRLVSQQHKRLLGATDGFDSCTTQSQMMLGMLSTLNAWFADQLSEKVSRGMRDAFDRGDNIRPPGFGYKLVPRTDEHGNIVFNRKGLPDLVKVIDRPLAKYVVLAFRLLAEKLWSPGKISRYFNRRQVGGRTSWDATYLKKCIFKNRTYVGEECDGMTRTVKDPDTGAVQFVPAPETEWRRRPAPDLRIVDDELWSKVQARMKECSDAYSSQRNSNIGRASAYPKQLLQPICGCCGKELSRGNSGKSPSLCCINGVTGKHLCTFRGYKSIRIMETCVLDRIVEVLFTDDRLTHLVERANEFLAVEAQRPKKDLAPLQKQIRNIKGKIERLTNKLELSGSDTVAKRIADRERELQIVEQQFKDGQRLELAPPPPLTCEDVGVLLADLRGLLTESKAKAAPVLRKLTGPIVVDQKLKPGAKKPTWTARFELNEVPVLLELAQKSNNPTAGTLAYLNTCRWKLATACDVTLEQVPRYVTLAPVFLEMEKNGAPINAIAAAHNVGWQYVRAVLSFAKTGTPPSSILSQGRRPKRKRRGQRIFQSSPRTAKYIEHSPLVTRLRDEDNMSFDAITGHLNNKRGIAISYGTVLRAYDYAHPELAKQAVEEARDVNRGRKSGLGEQKHQQIRELLVSKRKSTDREIADQIGCGASTVQRERQRMTDAGLL